MADLEANKAIALEFIEALGRIDVDAFLDFMSDDVHFETAGEFPFSGVKTKQVVAAEFPNLRKVLPGGLKFDIRSITAEDDRVYVEMIGKAKTFDGCDYNNHYCYAFVIRNGKIRVFRDYCDSWLSMNILHRDWKTPAS